MYRTAALMLAVIPAAGALAQSDLASKIINDPAEPQVTGAKGKLVNDQAAQGGKALRVTVAQKGANNWDSVIESAINKPVRAGDKLILSLEARLEKGDAGSTSATIPYAAVQQIAAPYKGVVSGQLALGPDWKPFQITGRADKNYAPGELKATIQVGNARQVVDLGPIVVLNMGQ